MVMRYIDLGLKEETVEAIDDMRGLVTRTAYLRDIVEKYVSGKDDRKSRS